MTKEDMDAVLDEGIKVAICLLEKNGELFPFGVVKSEEGDLRHVHLKSDEARPGSDVVIISLRAGLKRDVGPRYLAMALVSDVTMRERETGAFTNAIRVEIEASGNLAVTCYLPYSLVENHVVLGELKAEARRSDG